MSMFTFPNPVNEYAARTVAAGVVLMSVSAIVFQATWLLPIIALGFWARVASGPRFSPLGQLATRVVAPRLPWGPKLVAGPPKRFAQAIGVLFSTSACILWFGFGLGTATWIVMGALAAAALLESAFGLCLGCIAFGQLMRLGVIPEEVCASCADLSLRYPSLGSKVAQSAASSSAQAT